MKLRVCIEVINDRSSSAASPWLMFASFLSLNKYLDYDIPRT